MFEPARRTKTTDIIIEKVRTAILEGRLRPGDRLPPEKELGEQFGVSRQTMREALRALEHLGLIVLRKGSGGGAFVVEVQRRVVTQNLANYLYFKNLTIENLSEIRRILEPYATRCAVRNMTAGDLARLEEINARTAASIRRRDWDTVTRHEVAFHRLIADQTDNPILVLLLDFVETLLEDFKTILKPEAAFMEAVLASHESICAAIAAADEERAAAEMLDHILQVETYLGRLKQDRNGAALWENCLQTA